MLLLTIGIAMMLQQIIILVAGTQTRYVPSIVSGSSSIWGVVLSNQQILSVVVAFALVLSLGGFLKWGKQGRAIRAVSQDREIAAASGVSPDVIFILTVIISGTLAGIAGVLVSPIEVVTPETGWSFMVTAFSVTVLAGLGGPIWGIVVSAAIVSYAELLTAFFIAPMLKEAAAFTILILTLMFKPSGLFGKKRI
jgi:branched-chain amino acid transport system permease protein